MKTRMLLSLLLILAMCLPMIPASALAEARIADREQRAALQAEYDQYGGVEEAMSAYAQSRLRFQKALFASMADAKNFGFRTAISKVYDTGLPFADVVIKYMVEAGIAVSANDNDWNLSENETRLYMENLFLLAEMEALTFEEAAGNIQDYVAGYNAGLGVAELCMNVITTSMNAIPFVDEAVLKDAGAVFAKNYGEDSFFCHLFLNVGDYYNVANNTGELAKIVGEAVDANPGLENLMNGYRRMQAGRSLLAMIEEGGVEDDVLDMACLSLSDSYAGFAAELIALAGDEAAREKLEDNDYLDSRLNAHIEANFIAHPADTVTTSVATILRCADVLITNGVGQGAFEIVQSIGDLTLGTKSTFVHFQAMRSLDTLYEEILEAQQEPKAGAPWEDYYNYALNIQRLCKIALLGERHLYEMTTEDAGALLTLSDVEAERTQWYEARVNTLQMIHDNAGAYMTALAAHYGQLSGFAPGIESLLGHERELTTTIGGTVVQDLWYAKADGSGEPDKGSPNPNAGMPVANLPVYLMAGETLIAKTTTDENGDYRFTVYQYEIEGKQTQIVFGDDASSNPQYSHMAAPGEETEGTYAVKTIAGLSSAAVSFRGSYPYNLDEGETPLDANDGRATVSLPYADDEFLGDANEYSHNLAIASLGLSAASLSAPSADGRWTFDGRIGRDANIRAAWRALGFELVQSANYDLPLSEANGKAGFTIAQKVIIDEDAREDEPREYRVVGVAIQGDVDTAQWASTLSAARDEDGDQQGVGAAAQEIFDALAAYLTQVDDGMPVCLWITGFSRGGAIAGAVAQKVCTTSALAYKWDKLFAYTFAAPETLASSLGEESRAGVFNIVYEEDPVAAELFDGWFYKRLGETLTFGGASVAYGQRIASAFNELADGNANYNPMRYTANRDALTMLGEKFADQLAGPGEYAGEMQALVTAVAQWTYLCGDPNAAIPLEEKHRQVVAITGEPGAALLADIDAILNDAIAGMSALVVQALPENAQQNLEWMLTDVLLLAAHRQGDMSSLRLSENATAHLVALVSALASDMSDAASVHGMAFAHHPEVYLAWMMGVEGDTLFGKEPAMVFDTLVLPQRMALAGDVVEVDPEHGDYQPCAGAIIVAATADGTTYTTTTDENGAFTLTGVDAGLYTITASKGEHEETIEFELTNKTQYCGEIILGESVLDIYYRYLRLEVAPKEGLSSLAPVIGTVSHQQAHWPELAHGGAKGLVSAAVCDFDGNGTQDLVAIYATNKALLVQDHWPEHFTYELRLYQIENGEVVLADTVGDFLHIDNYIFDCFGPVSVAIVEDGGMIHILGYTWQQSSYSYGSDMTACYRVENGRFVSEWADEQFAVEAAGMMEVREEMKHLGGYADAQARAWLGGMLTTFAHFDLYGDLNEPLDYIYTLEDFTDLHAILGGDMKPKHFEPTALESAGQ